MKKCRKPKSKDNCNLSTYEQKKENLYFQFLTLSCFVHVEPTENNNPVSVPADVSSINHEHFHMKT